MSTYRETANVGTWVKMGDLELLELARQEYTGNNCIFAVGLVDGFPPDTHYLWLEKDGLEPTAILLRADELASIAWLASGALWSHLVKDVNES
jgi:hypothetical protein